MGKRLVEFIPNISEGRDQAAIDQIVSDVCIAEGTHLLDVSSDPDHNRTVLTLVGEFDAMPECARRLYAAATRRIDLRGHTGAHPRIGAVDVAPFVPLQGAEMQDCIALAQQTGRIVAAEFDLPVYLYAEAASGEKRARLADIRRGGFEGLARKIASPQWRADYGPAEPHPSAGATAIGARFFLVAYNIVLDTPDATVAQCIARAVRESSGGLPRVQAIGLHLESRGLAQVSMNLLDYRKASIPDVHAAVRDAAQARGAQVVDAEIVGMIPRGALAGVSPDDLKIANFHEELILENALPHLSI